MSSLIVTLRLRQAVAMRRSSSERAMFSDWRKTMAVNSRQS